MESRPELQDTTKSQRLERFLETETSMVVDSLRWLLTQEVSVATVLAVVNITVIGFGSSNKQAGMFLLGAVVTAILLIAYLSGLLGTVPLACRLIELEDKIRQHVELAEYTSISMVLLAIQGPKFIGQLRQINAIDTHDKKLKAMQRLRRDMYLHYGTGWGTSFILFFIAAQILAVPILVFVFHWQFL